MADFKQALQKVIINEGGYVNEPDDKGGETFMGISRKFHPNLEMWNIIDEFKRCDKDFKNKIKTIPGIIKDVEDTYKTYWDSLYLDLCKKQDIAEMLFDDCVNRGKSAVIKTLSNMNFDMFDKTEEWVIKILKMIDERKK